MKTKKAENSKKFISIKFKMTLLVLLLSLVSLAGMGILVLNGSRMQQISRDIAGQYEDAMTSNYFSKFDDFLNAIQASSGISQNLGETFYMLKDTLSRKELAKTMENEYHKAFARETNLLGGGAFYEPYSFYHDVHDFHYFVSKELTAAGIPSESNAHWVGGEWAWDVDTYEEGWYQAALPKGWNRATPREKRYHWSELYVDTSVDALMVSVCIPIYSMEKVIVGVATVDVSLSTLQKMVSSFPLPTPSTQIVGFSAINNATFAISGSEKYDIVPYPEGSWLKELEGVKPGQTISKSIKLGGDNYSLTAYSHESGIGLAALIPDLEKYAKVDALQASNFVTVISIFLVMVVIIIIVLFAISSWIVKPVRRTFSMLETFASGDLTQNISTNGRDELAQMMRMIDKTQQGIKHIIMAIGEKAQILHGNSRDLSSVASQLADSANGTVAKSTEVASTAEQMAVNINQMAVGTKQANANVNEVANAAGQMSTNMNTIAAAVEEMSASISQIAGNAYDTRKITKDATAKSGDATDVMNKLGIAAKEIGKVTNIIKKIADKTNLLALNATIEAASAGEAGKGFAVVAGEIKELANQSASSADDIASKVESIQAGTGEAVMVINDVSGIIERINQSVEAIAGHVEQQTKASNEIASNVAQTNKGAKRVASAIDEIAKGTNDVSRNASEAAKGANDVSNSTVSMSQAAKESAQGASQVNQSSSDLAKIAEDLKQTIARFKM
jgi:methyl-accepting chemotaxis protein